jgi:hypothetical protein
LYRGDRDGLSDPYAIVTLGNHAGTSKVIEDTLSPEWNEAVLIDGIKFYGDMAFIQDCGKIKSVTIQLWDQDLV